MLTGQKDSDLIITTIQKLNNAISGHYRNQLEHLKNERFVFIFDECHRSQFGETHGRITEFFSKSQLFGFTGTLECNRPIVNGSFSIYFT